jgi:serine phosphatase RsbU (regulator of sigma subunit)
VHTTHPAERAVAVMRGLEWRETGPDTAATTTWVARTRASSPRASGAILDSNFFAEMPADTAVGLVESDGALYLRAARMRRSGERARGCEVFVAVDSLYLAGIAAKIQTDVRIDVSPNVFVDESSVQVVGDDADAWADSSFTVEAPFFHDVDAGSFWQRNYYLARTFLPVGNWLESPLEGNRMGAVQLKLYTSPHGLVESLTSNALVLTSQAFAIAILVGIALLFFIVELSAVRTGRSIIKGIVTDVKSLTEAAARFGQGDLHHRVTLSGKDEMGRLAATFNDMAANIEQHQEVLIEKERLEADLAVARQIQQRMLPQSPPIISGLDVAGLSIPSREVGGDLFYFLPVAAGRLGLTIGDVSGKSVPAALLMSNVLAALKSEARIVDKEDEILDHLNRLIVEQVEPGRFVTFFYGVVDPEQRTVRYACAGHNPPLLMRDSGEAEWLEEAGVPLGVLPDSIYTPVEKELQLGDVLVLYSDGVTEAQRATPAAQPEDEDEPATESEFFDEHRLESAVRDARDRTAAEIVAHVMDAIRSFTEGAEQSDDLTLVVVKVTPR